MISLNFKNIFLVYMKKICVYKYIITKFFYFVNHVKFEIILLEYTLCNFLSIS